jgi:hypothetical protein
MVRQAVVDGDVRPWAPERSFATPELAGVSSPSQLLSRRDVRLKGRGVAAIPRMKTRNEVNHLRK